MERKLDTQLRGTVFNIQRYNMHDGDGIRTLVFLKGCSLRCGWCANPEGMEARVQLQFTQENCLRCGACAAQCPSGACVWTETAVAVRWDACRHCGACADVCPPHARVMRGRSMTVEEVMREVCRDAVFFRRSHGGMTLSGGEALLQSAFSAALLRAARSEGMTTAIETCGNVPWAAFSAVLEYTDLFLFDLKHMDSARHRQYTGAGNELILENARRLAANGARMRFRTPVIPGVNDAEENLRATARFAAALGAEGLELLPYHAMGAPKYPRLGRVYAYEGLQPPEAEKMERLRALTRMEMETCRRREGG